MRSGQDRAANLAEAERLVREAAADGAAFVATPEMTPYLVRGREALDARLATEADDPSVEAFAGLARALSIHILLGSTALRVEGRPHNRSLLFAPSGAVVARYSKMHMFDADVGEGDRWRESATYQAGDEVVTASVGDLRVGLTICYDLRFAELYRALARAGCHLITVPAAFTVPTGRAHWEILLRARAIETGAFILAPAQGGQHEDGRRTWGRSTIVGPWGEVAARLDGDEPGYIIADADPERVREARSRLPAWSREPRV